MPVPEALNAQRALESLGLSGGLIQVEAPINYRDPEAYTPGDPVIGGDVMYRGRAAEKLAPLVSGMEWTEYNTCPYENLIDPSRLHLDPFGNLHICQGLFPEMPEATLLKCCMLLLSSRLPPQQSLQWWTITPPRANMLAMNARMVMVQLIILSAFSRSGFIFSPHLS